MKFFALVLIEAELITEAEHHSQNMPKCQMSSIFAIAVQSKMVKILFSHPLIFCNRYFPEVSHFPHSVEIIILHH